jgi:2-polyprenyl-3-methyl-5-hydroxy-6-metoxy-1,4-benzoquinol methylase
MLSADRQGHDETNGQTASIKASDSSYEGGGGVRSFVLDRVAPQIGAFDWYRQNVASEFLVAGPVHFLNVGTGGGVKTLRLLRKGNHVTTIEIDAETAARTRTRVERSGFRARHTGYVGHVLDVPVEGPFDGIMMCEVLEHIKQDFRALQRLSQWLLPGGRLIISTPTASWGQLPGDEVSATENGAHVRVGYDGPELDAMLADVGIIVLRRIYVGHHLVRSHIRLERLLHRFRAMGYGFSFASRPVMRWLDASHGRPLCQITLAVKRHR